ncbi:uncharacterized protein LOC121725590 [Aricia agestis]|uniref:uncharacterized protein LOC121725590 n=1 Tax=Aricia agestis TaxID=91739 RepID=UPI001C2022C4|nr:uncharacterized protein LOC121725590 [Aricia agestis]
MDTNNFLKWLKEKLLPNLPPNGIVVIDNAPYHSTQSIKATSGSLKAEMQNWLRDNNIPFDENMTRKELYPIVLRTKPPKKIRRRRFNERAWSGRTPPYHCDLNPIEYIWNLLKQRAVDKNVSQSEKEIEKLTRDAIIPSHLPTGKKK